MASKDAVDRGFKGPDAFHVRAEVGDDVVLDLALAVVPRMDLKSGRQG